LPNRNEKKPVPDPNGQNKEAEETNQTRKKKKSETITKHDGRKR